MFLIRVGRFPRPVSFDSFRPSHPNEYILAVTDIGTVVGHDAPICECPGLAKCTLVNNIHFSQYSSVPVGPSPSRKVRCTFELLNSIGTTQI